MRLQTFGIELSLEMDCWPELVVPEQVKCELTDEVNKQLGHFGPLTVY